MPPSVTRAALLAEGGVAGPPLPLTGRRGFLRAFTAFRGPFRTVDQVVASTAFAVSTLLLRGSLAWDDYPALLEDPGLAQMISCVRVEADPALSYTQGWVRVRRRGEQLCRAAADAPATVFFRDRAAALAALARLDVDETTVAGFLFG